MNFLKRARWIVLTFILLGLFLATSAENLRPQSVYFATLLEHFGTALIVAGLVGLFLELAEIKEFFEHRLLALLSRDDFVEIFDEKRLLELAVTSVAGIGKKRAENPHYERDDFAWTLAGVIDAYAGKPYRKDLFETVVYSILDDEEIRALGLDPALVPKRVVKVVTKSRYSVIPSAENDLYDFAFTLYEKSFPVPNLHPGKHFSLSLSIDGADKDEDWEGSIKLAGKMVEIEIDKKYSVRGVVAVEIELTQYGYGTSGSVVNYATDVTHNATVHFSSRHSLELQADVFGVTGNYNAPSITEHSVSLQYTGWVLPGQGYYIAWRPQTDPQVADLKGQLLALGATMTDRIDRLPEVLAQAMSAQKPQTQQHDTVPERTITTASLAGRLLLYATYLCKTSKKPLRLSDFDQALDLAQVYYLGYWVAIASTGIVNTVADKTKGEYQIVDAPDAWAGGKDAFFKWMEASKADGPTKEKWTATLTKIEKQYSAD